MEKTIYKSYRVEYRDDRGNLLSLSNSGDPLDVNVLLDGKYVIESESDILDINENLLRLFRGEAPA